MENITLNTLSGLNVTSPTNETMLYDLALNTTALNNDTVTTSMAVLAGKESNDKLPFSHENVTAKDLHTVYTEDTSLYVSAHTTIESDLSLTTMVPFVDGGVLVEDITTHEVPEEETLSGIPLSLLWVPYVILSLVLLLLMIVSFIRFHKRNGHKYRRRKALLLRQLNLSNILNQLQGRGGTSPPNGGVSTGKGASHSTRAKSPNRPQPSTSKSSSRPRKSRRPLVFTTNLNGSMVDLRCGERDSLQTFKSKRAQQAHNQNSASFWLLPPKPRTPAFPPGKSQTEPQDDEVFLLHHQTRL